MLPILPTLPVVSVRKSGYYIIRQIANSPIQPDRVGGIHQLPLHLEGMRKGYTYICMHGDSPRS